MNSLLQDLRFAARSFVRTPRFTIPAVLALALGIGATSAIFSVVRGVMIEPLPYNDPDRIVIVWEHNVIRNRPRNVIAPGNFVEWRTRNRSFEQLGMAGPARITMTLDGQPEEIRGMTVSADALSALGVSPALGRLYGPREDEEGNHQVMLVSHEFWQTRLGGRADVVGMRLEANTGNARDTARGYDVVGVMPPGFTMVGQRADFMMPYGWTVERLRSAPGRGASYGVARLRNGVTIEQAASDMRNIAAQLEKEVPDRNTGWSVTLVPVHEQTVDQIRPALLILAGAVTLVLVIACVNVANLLLARATVRQQEIGVRSALGARRGRLVRQMLSESLLLGLTGGIAGLALAFAFHRGLLSLVANRIPVPRLDQVSLDLTVVAFTMLLALGTGLLFGLLPAVVSTRSDSDRLREGGGRHGRGRGSRRALGALVVTEVALSLVLLAGAGLLIRSFIRLQNIDPGFRAAGVFTARMQLPGVRDPEPGRSSSFFTRAIESVAGIPGVRSAAGTSFLPLAGPAIGTGFFRLDRPEPSPESRPTTTVRPITPGFFRTMGIPLVMGRDFDSSDRPDSSQHVAIVSAALVKRVYPDENPIGKHMRIRIGGADDVEIVGVVGDIKNDRLDAETGSAVYLPHTQLEMGQMTVVVRTDLRPLQLADDVARAVHTLDPTVPMADVRTLETVVDATLARPRVVAVLLIAFSVIALVLAAVGVYGVMAYSVAQRRQEIGVRIALGATSQSVFGLILRQASVLIGAGVLAGLLLAAATTRLLSTLLYQTEPFDALTFAVTAAVLMAVGVIASLVPAWRGMQTPPVEALRDA
jgi:putative ABC transport system permease protein